jgi:hypothetical protein
MISLIDKKYLPVLTKFLRQRNPVIGSAKHPMQNK